MTAETEQDTAQNHVTHAQVNSAVASLASDPAALDAAVQRSISNAAPKTKRARSSRPFMPGCRQSKIWFQASCRTCKEALARLDENLPAIESMGLAIGSAVPAAAPLVSRMAAAETTLQSILTALHTHFGVGKIAALPDVPRAPAKAA